MGPPGFCPQCLLQVGLESHAPGDSLFEPIQSAPSASPSAFELPTTEQLAHRFPQLEIFELIGRGGMGVVYKARQKDLDRFVAVKILPPGVNDDPAFAERFTHEAKALAKLNHPNIVTLYEFGQTDGLFFFLMEFVDGMNLRQLLNAGRMAPPEAVAIVPQICDALQYAHDAGIVNRDIKTRDILLDQVVVAVAKWPTFMGLAKLAERPGVVAARNRGRFGEVDRSRQSGLHAKQYMVSGTVRSPIGSGSPGRHLFAGRGFLSDAHRRIAHRRFGSTVGERRSGREA